MLAPARLTECATERVNECANEGPAIAGRTYARPMAAPETLRQFRKDYEVVAEGARPALLFLAAARRHASDARTMARTRLAAQEVGAALRRMHDGEGYKDAYRSWAALCRSVGIPLRDSYDLMNAAAAAEKLPEGSGAVTAGLSHRQRRALRGLEPEEAAALVGEAESGGDSTPSELQRLKEQLRSTKGRVEAEAPRGSAKAPRSSGPVQLARRHLTILRNVRMPVEAPPALVEDLRRLLDDVGRVLDKIGAAVGEASAAAGPTPAA